MQVYGEISKFKNLIWLEFSVQPDCGGFSLVKLAAHSGYRVHHPLSLPLEKIVNV
jgi:hypothetical protein